MASDTARAPDAFRARLDKTARILIRSDVVKAHEGRASSEPGPRRQPRDR